MKPALLPQAHQKLKTTTLHLKGKEFSAKIYDLHQTAHEELPEDKKHHLLLKEISYFEKALEDPTKYCIVSTVEGKMAGMMILSQFNSYKEALTKKAVTFNDVEGRISQKTKEGTIWTIQSLCRLSKYKSYSVGQDLLKQAQKIIQEFPEIGPHHLFAQAADDNKPSLDFFIYQGFISEEQWITDYPRHLLYKKLPSAPTP